MKFYKKNRHFILGLFAIAIASLFFANQSSILAAEIPREWEFAQKAGGTSSDIGYAMSVDADGNSYVAGYFGGTAGFGDDTLVSSGGQDIFVAKLSSTGERLWAKKAGGTSSDIGYAMSVDADGNSYVAGYFGGTAGFGDTTLISSGSADIFVAKLSSTGEWLWAKKAGGTSNDYGKAMSVDADGNSYVAGYFGGTAGFGDDTLVSSGGQDIFVAKLSSTGERLWAKKAGGTSYDYGYAMSVDADGNSYVAGYFEGTADFGDTTLVSSGGQDIFVAKLSSTGEWLWAKKAGGTSYDYGYAMSVDADGNPYVAGYFGGTADFGDTTLVSSGSADIFVAKLSSTGERLWAKKAGGTSSDIGYAMSVDADGNSYVAGYFQGTADFGDDTLVSSGSADIFVAKLSSTGEWLWAKRAGGTSQDYGRAISISVDADGNSYVAGYFEGTADFGDTTLVSSGSADVFVAKIGPPWVVLPDSIDNNKIIEAFQIKNYQQSNGYLSGSKPISLNKTNGHIPANLSLKNGSNKLSLPTNLQFKKPDTSDYNGIIYPPTTHSVSTVDGKPVLSAISVGSTTESLTLTNGAATLGIPVVGSTIGDPVSIYSSQDGESWTYEKGGIVSDVDGQPYVQFTTDHFTYFAITENTEGVFLINNGDSSTDSQNVTLTIAAPGASQMRFKNQGSTRSDRENYSTNKSRTLSEGFGNKTVNAQFEIDGQIFDVSESILYGQESSQTGQEGQGHIRLSILGGETECVYGTSVNLGNQDSHLNPAGYVFTGDFAPANRYCSDYKGLEGRVFTIQTTDLTSQNGEAISGTNVFISHDTPAVQGDLSCTGHNGEETQFFASPLSLMEKIEQENNDKICRVDLENVKIKVNVPAYQAPGSYQGVITITLPNGF